jgi:hypothetical protein
MQSVLYDRLQQMPALLSLPSHPRFLETARKLLDTKYVGVWPRVQQRFDRFGDGANLIKWHHDYLYNGGTRSSFTFWMPVVDITPEMGLLKIVPGSHLRDDFRFVKESNGQRFSFTLEGDVVQNLETVAPEVRAGDCVIFHSLSVHTGSPVTIPGRARLTVLFRMQDLTRLEAFVASREQGAMHD